VQIAFDLTPEDLWQWTLYYRRNKHFVRPAFLVAWLAALGLMLVLLLSILAISLLHHQPVPWRLLFYSLGIAWLAYRFIPPGRKRVIGRYARDPGQFCNHVITIDPAGIEETTPVSQNKMVWSRLTSIEESAMYLYLCVKGAGAYIIPKSAFSSPHNADVFLNTARRYWDVSKSGATLSQEEPAVWPPPPRIGA